MSLIITILTCKYTAWPNIWQFLITIINSPPSKHIGRLQKTFHRKRLQACFTSSFGPFGRSGCVTHAPITIIIFWWPSSSWHYNDQFHFNYHSLLTNSQNLPLPSFCWARKFSKQVQPRAVQHTFHWVYHKIINNSQVAPEASFLWQRGEEEICNLF